MLYRAGRRGRSLTAGVAAATVVRSCRFFLSGSLFSLDQWRCGLPIGWLAAEGGSVDRVWIYRNGTLSVVHNRRVWIAGQ